jgi:hypothetical protein
MGGGAGYGKHCNKILGFPPPPQKKSGNLLVDLKNCQPPKQDYPWRHFHLFHEAVMTQEIPRILWNPKVHHRIHKNPLPVSVPNQINLVNALHPTS